MASDIHIEKIFSDADRLNAAFAMDKHLLNNILVNKGFIKALLDPKAAHFGALLRNIDSVDRDTDALLGFVSASWDRPGERVEADAHAVAEWLKAHPQEWEGKWAAALVGNPALAYRVHIDKPKIFEELLKKGSAIFTDDTELCREIGAMTLAINFKGGEGGLSSDYWRGVYDDIEQWRRAIETHDLATIRALLEKKDVAHFIDSKHRDVTALMWAAKRGHTEIAQRLIDKGAKLDEKDLGDSTALIWAAAKGYTEIAQRLIDRGAKLDEKNHHGRTALMFAEANGHTKIVQRLIDSGANLDEKDGIGYTALMGAVVNGYKEIVQQLIDKGANLGETERYGSAALRCAANVGHKEIAAMIEAALKERKQKSWGSRMEEREPPSGGMEGR